MQYKFLHVNKTAGTTLQHFLRNAIPEQQFFYADFESGPILAERVFLKRLIHDPELNLASPFEPVTFAVFRDPAERAFSAFKHISRLKETDAKTDRERRLF